MRLRRRNKRKTTTRRAAVHWHLSGMADTGNIIVAEKSDEITLIMNGAKWFSVVNSGGKWFKM
jgi:hypothetical protein